MSYDTTSIAQEFIDTDKSNIIRRIYHLDGTPTLSVCVDACISTAENIYNGTSIHRRSDAQRRNIYSYNDMQRHLYSPQRRHATTCNAIVAPKSTQSADALPELLRTSLRHNTITQLIMYQLGDARYVDTGQHFRCATAMILHLN